MRVLALIGLSIGIAFGCATPRQNKPDPLTGITDKDTGRPCRVTMTPQVVISLGTRRPNVRFDSQGRRIYTGYFSWVTDKQLVIATSSAAGASKGITVFLPRREVIAFKFLDR